MFLRNIRKFLPNYTALYAEDNIIHNHCCENLRPQNVILITEIWLRGTNLSSGLCPVSDSNIQVVLNFGLCCWYSVFRKADRSVKFPRECYIRIVLFPCFHLEHRFMAHWQRKALVNVALICLLCPSVLEQELDKCRTRSTLLYPQYEKVLWT